MIKKKLIILLITLMIPNNVFSAGSDDSSETSNSKLDKMQKYRTALGFIKKEKKFETKDKIEKAKKRLGEKSLLVNWIVSDVNNFIPKKKYDLWHDRAAFHFLRKEIEINNYVDLASNSISKNGKMIIATFSSNGPDKCSGIRVNRYNLESIKKQFNN